MDRQTSLSQRATGLSRSIWASLPWGYRLATVFMRLAADLTGEWGRLLGHLFLKAGVEGLPDPGPGWATRNQPSALPHGYLKREAAMAYQVALKKTGDPSSAADVVQDVLMKMVEENKIKAVPLKTALSFFVTQVGWTADSLTRSRKNRRQDAPKENDEGEIDDRQQAFIDKTFDRNPYWYDDPQDYRLIERLFSPQTWERKVKPALARIHPAMPEFFDRLLESPDQYNGIKDALRDLPGYPDGAAQGHYQNWLNWLRKKVAPLLKDLAEDVADGPALAHTAAQQTLAVRARALAI